MTNKWIVTILALVIGFVGGMLVGKQKGTSDDVDHKMAAGSSHGHHEMVEVPAGAAAPTVDFTVHEDPKSGYNIEITTTNFRFAPQNASTAHVFGEGHAHIYVDGKKINRVYGNWYYLADIGGEGEHEIRVELSANNHSTYAQNGEMIDVTKTVTVEPEAKFDASAVVEQKVALKERSLDPEIVTVTEGDSVRLVVTTDEAGDFHIAGYELEEEMNAEGETVIEFVADKAGRYNLELHPAAMAMEGGEMDMDGEHDPGHTSEDIEIGALVVNPK